MPKAQNRYWKLERIVALQERECSQLSATRHDYSLFSVEVEASLSQLILP